MKELFRIDDTPENKISYFHIFLFFASLPFPRFYSQVILISFVLHLAFHFKKSQVQKLRDRRILILELVLLLTFIGTIGTHSMSAALQDWDKHATALLFPLAFSVVALNLAKYKNNILYVFAITCTLVIGYLFSDALRVILFFHLPIRSIASPAFTNHNFSLPLNIHATYLSMYVALSILVFADRFTTSFGRLRKLYIICCVVLGAGLAMLAARSVFIAMVLMAIVIFPMFYHGKNRLRMVVFFIAALIAIALMLSADSLKQRFVTDLKEDLSATADTSVTDSRMQRWHSAVSVIATSPVIGHGTGSEVRLLTQAYFKDKLYHSYLHGLNAHNEYLSLMIKFGIFGVVIYVLTSAWGFRQAIKRKDMVFLGFMILVSTVSFSENILDVNKGVFFYSAFFSFFIFCGKGEN